MTTAKPAGTDADWSVGRGAPTQPGVTPAGNEAMTYWAGHVTDRLVRIEAKLDQALALLTNVGSPGSVPDHEHTVTGTAH